MKTRLKGNTSEFIIDNQGPMAIIGESINPTRRKKLITSLKERDFDYVLELARTQIDAGADILDINVGLPGEDETGLMQDVVKAVQEELDVPLCLDSNNHETIAAGLSVANGKPLVNSVNGEKDALDTILPVVAEHGAAVIGLAMDDDGISNDPDTRLAIAGVIIERATNLGIPLEDILIDPLVLTVGADHKAGWVTLETIKLVYKEFGVNINLGASNVSFGLPDRLVINQAFLTLAAGVGASCAITNPVKLTSAIRATDLVLGRDSYAGRYIKNFRAIQKKLKDK
jgi:5-methyltetrahydrofolate--homocysteine methyltransferase